MNRRQFFTTFGAAAAIAPVAALLPARKVIEGKHFTGPLTISDSADVTIQNCSFAVPDGTSAFTITGSRNCVIRNCSITGTFLVRSSLQLDGS